ncbi:NAD(P)/FAD-dependent oxidoreductase [Nocardioides sp. WS12]|uniref:FAD-dependent oxidoreductase n=1 Tax=Nocardioides sp. WS12 TaxID=2486272 RepID=UPI0015FE6D17|nr:NAD(P)/FAD-dependent oxidoreductase [Nocardioides sp. WS12]
MTSRTTEVAVVGASLAGLATALGLARSGVHVTVLDTVPAPRLPWTAVHHWSVLPVLEGLGVLDDALLAGEATAHWGLHVLATGERHVYDVRELGPEVRLPFNLRLEPATLRGILRAALLALPNTAIVEDVHLEILRQHEETVDLVLDGGAAGPQSLRARWVVGADGPASAVRRHAGLAFEGTTWTERCVVALVHHDFGALGYPDTTFQVDGHHGAVVERAGRHLWRYLFQESLSHDEAAAEQRVVEVLEEVTGVRPEVLDWFAARMHQRSATSYRSGRVVLVGDAAHVTHPMTGHTSLSGWCDAASLAPVLTDAVHGDPDDAVGRWAESRRRHFLDDAAPASLGRRNLVAQIRDPRRLEVELDAFRQASVGLVAPPF